MSPAAYAFAADFVTVAHFAFIVFVVAGGLLLLRWPSAAWIHLPAALWGAAVEAFGWTCPLTPLENALRSAAMAAVAGSTHPDDGGHDGAYAGDFIGHYLLPLIYPEGLTREVQWLLAALVLVVNALIYGAVWRRHRRRGQSR